jgi:N-acetylneuraminic acid mutarotase
MADVEERKEEFARPAGLKVSTGKGETVNWSEVRLSGKLPERRSNHCSFIVNDNMYIHGGRDIKEGPMGNMWKMSISGIHELMDDPENGVCWEAVNCKGTIPGKISHHKAAVFGLSVIVFGGIDCLDNFEDTFEFNSQTHTWSKIK